MEQELCEKCGANWPVIKKMLTEPQGTDNHELADRLIRACVVCREHFLSPLAH